MRKLLVIFLICILTGGILAEIDLNDPVLLNYRKKNQSLDSLLNQGFVYENKSGRKFFTGYSYDKLYDWDQYFETIIQIYMGWEPKYIKNGVIIFLNNQEDSGFIPRSVPSDQWTDKEHVKPFLAQISYLVYRAYGEKDWILKQDRFTALKKYIDYWLDDMDKNDNGLSEWMSAPHSGMDTQHERAGYWEDRNCEGVDLNSYLVRELKAFANLAELAGKKKIAKKYDKLAEERKQTIRELLWDEEDGFYYDRKAFPDKPLSKKAWIYSGINTRSADQPKIPVKSASSFAVLWARIATKEQAERIIEEHLLNPREFWTPYPVAVMAKSEPWYDTKPHPGDMGCNWRANVWIPTNYMIYNGLNFYGYENLASALAYQTNKLLKKSGNCEYYNSETGEGLGLKPFWGWSLLGHFFPLEEKLDWNINIIK